MRILLLQLSGWICVLLALAGIVLPLLPTTPFLLLAAWCFSRSSPRFHHWLMHHRWFGSYLRNIRAGHGLPRRQALTVLGLLWSTLAISAWMIEHWWLRGLLLLIGLLVSWHLATLCRKGRRNPIMVKP